MAEAPIATIKALIRKRGSVQGKVSRIIDSVKKFDKENGDELSEVKDYEISIIKCEDEYSTYHNLILELIEDDQFEKHEEKMADFETSVRIAKKIIRQIIRLFPTDKDGSNDGKKSLNR